MRLDDPDVVRREYADPDRFAVRRAAWESAEGVDPRDAVVAVLAEVEPARVLDVGCGDGHLAARVTAELGAEVVAVDQSEQMVELARARGLDARVADAGALPLASASFDAAVAAWMLYHVPDRAAALAELARVVRPGGRVIAVTNSERNLHELWDLLGTAARRTHPFSAENAAPQLRDRFRRVERLDASGTLTFSFEEAKRYVAASVARSHLADRLPRFTGLLRATRAVAVFVCEP